MKNGKQLQSQLQRVQFCLTLLVSLGCNPGGVRSDTPQNGLPVSHCFGDVCKEEGTGTCCRGSLGYCNENTDVVTDGAVSPNCGDGDWQCPHGTRGVPQGNCCCPGHMTFDCSTLRCWFTTLAPTTLPTTSAPTPPPTPSPTKAPYSYTPPNGLPVSQCYGNVCQESGTGTCCVGQIGFCNKVAVAVANGQPSQLCAPDGWSCPTGSRSVPNGNCCCPGGMIFDCSTARCWVGTPPPTKAPTKRPTRAPTVYNPRDNGLPVDLCIGGVCREFGSGRCCAGTVGYCNEVTTSMSNGARSSCADGWVCPAGTRVGVTSQSGDCCCPEGMVFDCGNERCWYEITTTLTSTTRTTTTTSVSITTTIFTTSAPPTRQPTQSPTASPSSPPTSTPTLSPTLAPTTPPTAIPLTSSLSPSVDSSSSSPSSPPSTSSSSPSFSMSSSPTFSAAITTTSSSPSSLSSSFFSSSTSSHTMTTPTTLPTTPPTTVPIDTPSVNTEDASSGGSGEDMTLVWVIIGVVAGVVITFVVSCIVVRRAGKKQRALEQQGQMGVFDAPSTTTPPPSSSSSSSTTHGQRKGKHVDNANMFINPVMMPQEDLDVMYAVPVVVDHNNNNNNNHHHHHDEGNAYDTCTYDSISVDNNNNNNSNNNNKMRRDDDNYDPILEISTGKHPQQQQQQHDPVYDLAQQDQQPHPESFYDLAAQHPESFYDLAV